MPFTHGLRTMSGSEDPKRLDKIFCINLGSNTVLHSPTLETVCEEDEYLPDLVKRRGTEIPAEIDLESAKTRHKQCFPVDRRRRIFILFVVGSLLIAACVAFVYMALQKLGINDDLIEVEPYKKGPGAL